MPGIVNVTKSTLERFTRVKKPNESNDEAFARLLSAVELEPKEEDGIFSRQEYRKPSALDDEDYNLIHNSPYIALAHILLPSKQACGHRMCDAIRAMIDKRIDKRIELYMSEKKSK